MSSVMSILPRGVPNIPTLMQPRLDPSEPIVLEVEGGLDPIALDASTREGARYLEEHDQAEGDAQEDER